MNTERAVEIVQELVLYEADPENNSAPSNPELGAAIRVLGLPDAYDHYSSAVDNLEVVDDSDDDEEEE